MIDQAWLDDWIQPQYLQNDFIESCHRAFTSHPARLLVMNDFLLDEVAESLSRFLSREARFKSVYGLYSNAYRHGNISDVPEETWLEAEERTRFYRFSDYAGAVDESRPGSNKVLFQRFLSALRDRNFKIFFEELSGFEFGPVPLINAYSYKAGDFLGSHTDDVKNKRLSFVFYLSPDWERRFGGLLHMIDPQGRVTVIEPQYSSLVIFDVAAKTTHFIDPVKPCAGQRARLTISGWFVKPDGETARGTA
ncbi:MAG: 2OG-Fe(II) oxygenase [Blastocatellia bacterium]|nr:2OG-Fe(II) oxygenase [Blastocatellia bacterium]